MNKKFTIKQSKDMTKTLINDQKILHGLAISYLALIEECDSSMSISDKIEDFKYWHNLKKEVVAKYEKCMDELLANHINLNLP